MRHAINILRVLTNARIVMPPLRLVRRLCRKDADRPLPPSEGGKGPSHWQGLRALEFMRRWLRSERLVRHRGKWVVNSFLPPFPGRAYRRMFERICTDQRLPPHSAFLALTSRCPANCWHCSIKNRRVREELDRNQWLEVIAQLHDLGTSLIGFTGGEPLIREDLPDLIRAVQQGGAEAQLFTSGIGLTKALVDELRDAGLWAIGVSLDHTNADAANRKCGTSRSFDAAIAALEMSRRAGLYTFINAVADPDTVVSGEYRRLYHLACRMNLHELRFIEPMPCGRLANNGRDCFLDSKHIAELREFHREINRRGRTPKICAFNQIESPELFGCGAGTFHLYVDPSGEVCPCDFTPLSFGSLREEGLDVIWKRMSDAMRQPRRHCFIQTNATLVQRHATGRSLPLAHEVSCRIATEAPQEPLPDYFKVVTAPYGFPQRQSTSADT